MKIFSQLGILFGVCLAGALVSELAPFPFPSSVAAMLLLLALLLLGVLRPAQLGETAEFLTKNMAILFMPASVGVIESMGLIRQNGLKILLICVVSTFLTFAATAGTVSLLMRLTRKKEGGAENG